MSESLNHSFKALFHHFKSKKWFIIYIYLLFKYVHTYTVNIYNIYLDTGTLFIALAAGQNIQVSYVMNMGLKWYSHQNWR